MLKSKKAPLKTDTRLYKQIRNVLVLIWLTLVAYIVYTEWYNLPLSVLGV